MTKLHILVKLIVLFVFTISSLSGQVTKVNYYMEYDTSTCWYDIFIIVKEGESETVLERAQFNSQISFITPYNSTALIAQTHNPRSDNINGGGVTPIGWNYSQQIDFPTLNPELTYRTIVPELNPVGFYDSLYVDDTIKILSLDISLPQKEDHQKVRFFINGVDQSPNSGDFSNGFSIGNPDPDYETNEPTTFAPPSTVSFTIDTTSGDLIIDTEPLTSSCQNITSYQWYGPNGYVSSNADVFVSPYNNEAKGVYTLFIEDDFGYIDTLFISVGSTAFEYGILSDLRIDASPYNIGLHLPLMGDLDLDGTVTLQYRLHGQINYETGAKTVRAHDSMIVDGTFLNQNFHAGSILFTNPNTLYDLRIIYENPESGIIQIDTTILTPQELFPISSDTFYVSPGNGGGSGTLNDPYLGLQNAIDEVEAGDHLLVNDGLYAPFTIITEGSASNPITIESKNLHGAIIDGNNTSEGIITLGSFNTMMSYIIIDGFEIRNGKWAIDAQNTHDVLVRNNKIYDVDNGYINRRENGNEFNQIITNNSFIGRTNWPQTNGNIPSERGIDLRGSLNVVSNNFISNFGDGISTDGPPYGLSFGLDIFGNEITRIVDDLIEIDGTTSNSRVYQNKLLNGRAGVSISPLLGGPAYIFRNEIINTEFSAIKLNREPTGIFIIHNTLLNSGYGLSSPSGWQSTQFINNLVLSKEYVYEEFSLVNNGLYLYDYNGYFSERAGTPAEPWFKWDNNTYNSLSDLQVINTESNSIEIQSSDLVNVSIPTAFDIEVASTDNDLMPAMGASLINKGQVLDNYNKFIVEDGLPDLGAYEFNANMTTYGPDFINACEKNDVSNMVWNGSMGEGWFQKYNWTPCGIPTALSTVTIPGNLLNYPYNNTSAECGDLQLLGDGKMNLYKTSLEVNN